VDLLIVVGMFLTGFDAPTLNTLFVDKNLRYHGLIQAYSRTNRIYDATKTFGNIITFRDLEQATIDAITLFGNKDTRNILLEKSYQEYLKGFTDILTGEAHRGYISIVKELETYQNLDNIVTEKDKKAFVQLFGEYLRVENILQNYDEYTKLKAYHDLNKSDPQALKNFKATYHVNDEELEELKKTPYIGERKIQDFRSMYNDIREWLRREKDENKQTTLDWSDVEFEIDLLKSQEINLDFILELIFEKNKKVKNKDQLVEDIRSIIRASVGNRAKESLIVNFINHTDLEQIQDKASIIEAFFTYAQTVQKQEAAELIKTESLDEEKAKRYIMTSLKREYASENGMELNEILPRMSPLNPQYVTKKRTVFQKIAAFVEKFKGVGGQL
jgi:type I restriction enzyme R subunit